MELDPKVEDVEQRTLLDLAAACGNGGFWSCLSRRSDERNVEGEILFMAYSSFIPPFYESNLV